MASNLGMPIWWNLPVPLEITHMGLHLKSNCTTNSFLNNRCKYWQWEDVQKAKYVHIKEKRSYVIFYMALSLKNNKMTMKSIHALLAKTSKWDTRFYLPTTWLSGKLPLWPPSQSRRALKCQMCTKVPWEEFEVWVSVCAAWFFTV